MELSPKVEWKFPITKHSQVTCVAWKLGDKWQWNVYAYIFESHPLFKKPKDAIEKLPFHCGCTFDKMITISPSNGNDYDSSEPSLTLKLGSDYSHIYDDYNHHPSGLDGVPYYVLRDAEELQEALVVNDNKKD